jgi:hypothetical protein
MKIRRTKFGDRRIGRVLPLYRSTTTWRSRITVSERFVGR